MWVHFHARMISRSNAGSKSAVGAAAYQARERIEARGLVHDYTRRGDLVHKEILLPEDAPDWMGDRAALWDAAEDAADRSTRPDTAQTARAIDAALPRGLAREEQIELARDFAAEAFVARGMAVDLAIHDAPASDGGRNAHVHYLVATREVTPEGFGAVNREWARAEVLREWRMEWEAAADLAMERAGVMERAAAAEGGSGG
jgi:ATP-dependent exoDNAse (exonuclease V) alpha subunit